MIREDNDFLPSVWELVNFFNTENNGNKSFIQLRIAFSAKARDLLTSVTSISLTSSIQCGNTPPRLYGEASQGRMSSLGV